MVCISLRWRVLKIGIKRICYTTVTTFTFIHEHTHSFVKPPNC